MNKTFRVSIKISKDIENEQELELMKSVINTKILRESVIQAYRKVLLVENTDEKFDIKLEMLDHEVENSNKGEHLTESEKDLFDASGNKIYIFAEKCEECHGNTHARTIYHDSNQYSICLDCYHERYLGRTELERIIRDQDL